MWGNLRDSVAHAKSSASTGRLIAKIGDIVAPLDEEYETDESYSNRGEEEEDYYSETDESEDGEEEEVRKGVPTLSPVKMFGGALKVMNEKMQLVTAVSQEDDVDINVEADDADSGWGEVDGSFESLEVNSDRPPMQQYEQYDEQQLDKEPSYDPTSQRSTAEWSKESVHRLKVQHQQEFQSAEQQVPAVRMPSQQPLGTESPIVMEEDTTHFTSPLQQEGLGQSESSGDVADADKKDADSISSTLGEEDANSMDPMDVLEDSEMSVPNEAHPTSNHIKTNAEIVLVSQNDSDKDVDSVNDDVNSPLAAADSLKVDEPVPATTADSNYTIPAGESSASAPPIDFIKTAEPVVASQVVSFQQDFTKEPNEAKEEDHETQDKHNPSIQESSFAQEVHRKIQMAHSGDGGQIHQDTGSVHKSTVEVVDTPAMTYNSNDSSTAIPSKNLEEMLTLQIKLKSSLQTIKALQTQLSRETQEKASLLEVVESHNEEQELLLSAAQETHTEDMQEMDTLKVQMQSTVTKLENALEMEREQSKQQRQQFQRVLEEANGRAEQVESEAKVEITRQSQQLVNAQKRFALDLERSETRLNRAQTVVKEKDIEITQLQQIISDFKKTIQEHVQNNESVEEEADELHQENEELEGKLAQMEKQNTKMKNELEKLKKSKNESMGMQMELQMMKEEQSRNKERMESQMESQSSNQAVLTAERDAAKAEALDLEHRLAALQGDVEVLRSDFSRSQTANANLHRAMETFQSEREAELALLEESRVDIEDALKSSHYLALEAVKEENETILSQVQEASNKAVRNMMGEMNLLELKQEEYRKDNVNLRRSLDEAIKRLQTNQEDVIDRAFMKNILLDWHSKSGKSRRDVLLLMSSVLHFTDHDRDNCGIGEHSGAIGKVVGAVAPPLTPAKKSMEDLEGDTVREKWVSFLLSECGDDSPEKQALTGPKVDTSTRTKRNTASTIL